MKSVNWLLWAMFFVLQFHQLLAAERPSLNDTLTDQDSEDTTPASEAPDGYVAGTCPSAGDCCSSHATPGCDDFLCCDVVCNQMPFCCEGLWSAACVNIAAAVCDVCEPPSQCPQPGDCCTGRSFSAGCERTGCCQTVCALDEFCCIGEWDSVCARKAVENCYNVCECVAFGDFDENAVIDLHDVAHVQICFSGDGSAPIAAKCACADYDGDGDANLLDTVQFIIAWSSP